MYDIRRITWQQGTDVLTADVATPAEVITKARRIRRDGGSILSVFACRLTSEEVAAWN